MSTLNMEDPHHPQGFFDDTTEIFDDFYNLDVGTEGETNFKGHRVHITSKVSENFTHIVDLHKYEYHKVIVYKFLGQILQSVTFRTFIMVLVLINAILIGLQTVPEYDEEYGTVFTIVDHILLSIFIFEIMLKWAHDFRMFWVVSWNVLDFFIVCMIIASAINTDLNHSKALVVIRIVRAFRSLRSVSSLSSLTIVTHTIFKSIGDMMSILFVLMIFMVVLAIMGVTLFDVPEISDFAPEFDNPGSALFMLFVCVTQDGWVDYMEAWRGQRYYWLPMAYIVIGIAVGGFIFSNLIIAVVVANLEMGVEELRAEKRATLNPLTSHEDAFHIVDVSSTYTILSGSSNEPLRIQRPMKVPFLRHLNPRRLQSYVQIIVALEQNMLEYELIQKDLERLMSVVVDLAKSLQALDPSYLEANAVDGLKAFKDLPNLPDILPPMDPLRRASLLHDLKTQAAQTRVQ